MTQNTRLTIMLTPEIEAGILELRKTDQYIRAPLSEIVRDLLVNALKSVNTETADN